MEKVQVSLEPFLFYEEDLRHLLHEMSMTDSFNNSINILRIPCRFFKIYKDT